MTLNEALIRQNFISKILLKNEDKELPKSLKAKIMSMRISLSKIRTQFEQECQLAVAELKPEGIDKLAGTTDRTEEQELELKKLTDKLNEDYNAFVIEKGKDIVTFDKTLTFDEYVEILEVNAGAEIIINGTKITSEEFLEIINSLFVDNN